MFESTNNIVWDSPSDEEVFAERVAWRERYGQDTGNHALGDDLLIDFDNALDIISKNINTYQVRSPQSADRVAPLKKTGYLLIYRKEYDKNTGAPFIVIMDVRKSY